MRAFTTPGGQYRVSLEDLLEFLQNRGIKIPAELQQGITSETDWQSIMVIDDDSEINKLITRFLKKNLPNYNFFQAFDGFEAGAIITDKHPGFIILDIDLPGVDGHKLCNTIKSNPAFGKPFVIAITGMEDNDTQQRILHEGADAFFSKPLDMDRLKDTVKDFIAKLEAEYEH